MCGLRIRPSANADPQTRTRSRSKIDKISGRGLTSGVDKEGPGDLGPSQSSRQNTNIRLNQGQIIA